jgi:uncharacterized phage protein (TIGR01671 family)
MSMNREIKFRMWTGSKMIYDTHNVIECLKQQIEHNNGDKYGYDHVGLHNSSFMQYTGFRDKIGVDIYEGDIVKVSDPYNIDGAEIVFSHEYLGGWVITNSKNNLNLGTRQHYIKVIGNIYENPELLQ